VREPAAAGDISSDRVPMRSGHSVPNISSGRARVELSSRRIRLFRDGWLISA
jgi:hypothetical protein